MNNLYLSTTLNNISHWIIDNKILIINYFFNIVFCIIIIVVGILFARIFSKGVNNLLLTHRIDITVTEFISRLIHYSIIIFIISASLGCIGVQTTSIITVLGAAGLTIGLALQNSLSNLAAGVLLVIFYPFRSGEIVDIGGVIGTIINIQIFCTTLKSADGKIIIIPNSKIISNSIINFSRESIHRNELIISVSYDTNIDKVIDLLYSIVALDKRVLKDMGIEIILKEFPISSINFIIRYWSHINNFESIYSDLLKKIKIVLDKQKISIYFSKKSNVN
ncbi:MAG: mechanosensitive ion channel [Pantoea sp. Brub]|nr:mechanosensitive ion channel [Pantoea sp. Brub]